jgi:UDP-N-acetylmuramyl pentapeptide phosphotransferase/UDP-N-acetylglucosamine-1-phosphate transferase
MTIAAAAFAGLVVTLAALRVVLRTLMRPPHLRQNFRGRELVGTAGVVLLASLAACGAVSLLEEDGRTVALVMTASGLAMGLLGLIDDIHGDRRAGGLVGHAKALLKGTFTTGMLKAAGGAVVGLAGAWAIGWTGVWIVVAGAVIALSSNLANLFDLRPGRVIKLWLPLSAWLAIVIGRDAPQAVLAGLGAGVAIFLVAELGERVMLGDTGAGLIGVVLGVGLVSVTDETGLVVALAVLLGLTLASEVVSFTRVIEAVPPLAWYDRLGRRP